MLELFLVIGDGLSVFLDETKFKLLVMLGAESEAMIARFAAFRSAECLS